MHAERTNTAPRNGLAACVVLAAAVRIGFLSTLWGDKLKLNDSWYYSEQARQLAHGRFFREIFFDTPGAEHGPLTSILMAPVSYTYHYQDFQRLVTVATGVALVWVIGRFTEELTDRTVGLVAAFIAAIYPNLWLNDGLIMSESVSMLLVALVLWAAWRAVHAEEQRAVRRSMVLLGVTLGLAMLARSELMLFAPVILLWVVWVRRRASVSVRPVLAAAACAGMVLAPWVVFNLVRFEQPVFLTTNDGPTLLGSNCPQTYAGKHLGGWLVTCIAEDPAYRPGEEPSVRSARQRSLAVHFALDHSERIPAVVAARIGRTLDVFAIEDTLYQDVGEGRPKPASWLGVVLFWAMAVASIFGAWYLPRRQRTLLLIPIGVVLVTTVLFYGAHRIRSSAEPSLVALTAVALVHWSRPVRRVGSTDPE